MVLALLADIFDALPVAVVIAGARREILMINREAESLLGYRREDLLGQAIEVLVPDGLRPSHIESHHAYLEHPAQRQMGANRDLTARRADGSLVAVEIALKPLAGADGPMVIAAIVDISTRKALEKQTREANMELDRRVLERTEQLEHSNREKLTMLNGLEQARAELERISRQDPLTALANRREFDQRVALEHARSQRHASPMCLAMLDIDAFKYVNDLYGHALGDEVLRRIAGILRAQCRAVDVVARYGGEEFAIAMPDTGLDEALTLCERIRCAVHSHAWCELRPELRVSISIGVAVRRQGETASAALARADGLLYGAKRNGRNRVEAS